MGKRNQRDIDRLIKILEGYVLKPSDYHYITHAQRKYGNVPLWVLTNINESHMISILTVMVKFRNVCAHGERLFTYRTTDSIWYKEFIKELKWLIIHYIKKHESISEQELYDKMGFPENWTKTRYRK